MKGQRGNEQNTRDGSVLGRREFLHRLGAVGLGALLAGCDIGRVPTAPVRTPTSDPGRFRKPVPWRIGRSGLGDLSSWWVMHSAHLEYALKELYQSRFAPAQALSANWDADKQALDIEQLVGKGLDLLLVEPMSSPYALSAVNQASSNGLPVILVSSPLEGADCVTWVTTDEEERARESAEWLAARVPRGRIVVLQSEPCQGSGAAWVKSARSVLIKFSGLQVDWLTCFWTTADAKRMMLSALSDGPVPVGLLVNHGTVGQGAVDALVERGMTVPPVAGADDNNGWLRTAREHAVTFLGFSGSARLGKMAVEAASLVLSGEPAPPVIIQSQMAFGPEQLERLYRPDLTDHYWAVHELPEAWIQAMFARQS